MRTLRSEGECVNKKKEDTVLKDMLRQCAEDAAAKTVVLSAEQKKNVEDL